MMLLQTFRHILARELLGEDDMTLFDGKYDFQLAGGFDRSYAKLPKLLRTAEYQKIAAPFVANINRVVHLYELPLQLIYWMGIMATVKAAARHEHGVAVLDDSRDGEEAVRNTAVRILTGRAKKSGGLAIGASTLAHLIGDESIAGIGGAKEGTEAALAAMVMASYAALETLAADLWIEAVNKHSELASNWVSKNSERQLPASVLAGYNFDLSRRMGTVLHDTKRVTFESLYDIREHYSHAFKNELNSTFEPFDDLIKVEKTRHLFAHRGGIIDRKFKDETKRFDEYKSATVGDRLRLTGPVVGEHVNSCVKCATALLTAVDDWSVAHP